MQFQPFLNNSSRKRQEVLAVIAFSGKKPSIVNANIQRVCKNWKVLFFPSSVDTIFRNILVNAVDSAHVLGIHVNDFGNVGRPLPHKIKNTSTAKRHFTAQAVFNCGYLVRACAW